MRLSCTVFESQRVTCPESPKHCTRLPLRLVWSN